MSLVVAMKCIDGVVVAADSCVGLEEGFSHTIQCAENAKLWHPYGTAFTVDNIKTTTENTLNNVIVGGVGKLREIQLVKELVPMPNAKNICLKTLVRDTVPDVQNIMVTYGAIADTKPYPDLDSTSFLIATPERIYVLWADYSVIQFNTFVAVGYCSAEAKGVWESITSQHPQPFTMEEGAEIIQQVMKVCAKDCIYVSEPIIIEKLPIEVDFKTVAEVIRETGLDQLAKK